MNWGYEQILTNYGIPEKLITVDDGPASVIRFSHLIRYT